METKIPDVKPLVMDSRVIPDYLQRETEKISPVPKEEGASFRSIKKETKEAVREDRSSGAGLTQKQGKALAEAVEKYLSDLNISLNFEVYDKTGELVIKVINRDTKEVIRQIPPDDLLKLHETLEELRGVLFNSKA